MLDVVTIGLGKTGDEDVIVGLEAAGVDAPRLVELRLELELTAAGQTSASTAFVSRVIAPVSANNPPFEDAPVSRVTETSARTVP